MKYLKAKELNLAALNHYMLDKVRGFKAAADFI